MAFLKMRLGEVAEQIRGVTYAKADVQLTDSEETIPLLRATNIGDGEVDFRDLIYVPKRYANPKQYLKTGDLLIASSSGSLSVVGKAGLIRGDQAATFGAFCKVIRPSSALDSNYLSHYFRTREYRSYISNVAEGANINNLRNADLDNLEIPLPALDEQLRIAAILDETDELVAKCRLMLNRLNELAESTFDSMFGDPMQTSQLADALSLEAITEKVIDCPHSTPKWTDSGLLCLRTTNLRKGDWDFSETRFVTKATHDSRVSRAELLPGDIILSREGTVGIGAIVPEGMVASMGQRLVQIRPNKDILSSEFLLSYLLEVLRPERLTRLLVGSTAKHINVGDLRKLKIHVPERGKQIRFEKVMAEIRNLRLLTEKSLGSLNEFFSYLQDRAFRGEL